jgi:hypothetical protein
MRLLSPIILIFFGAVYGLGNQFSMGDTIASQLIGNGLSGFATVAAQ